MSVFVDSNVVLIGAGRVKSIEEDFGDAYGKDQEFFIKALEEAANRLNGYLVKTCEQVFSNSEDIAATGGNAYALPADIYAGRYVYQVYYSYDGQEDNFEPLHYYPRRLFAQYPGDPEYFSIYNGAIYLDAKIQSPSKLRVEYEQRQPLPDLPRGTVIDRTITLGKLTLLQLDTGTVVQTDIPRLQEAQYLCTHSVRGVNSAKGIAVNGYDAGTGKFVVNHTLADAETVAVGDVITLGQNTTTHMRYDVLCKSFFVEYMRAEAELTDSSIDYTDVQRKLDIMLAEIAGIYNSLPSSPTRIAQLTK